MYWCHLVSDHNLDELHDFARQLGCRRIGFQGDHYDIDVETRQQAIDLGAEACDSRELVRRMKAVGLRLRPAQFTKWSLVSRGLVVPAPVGAALPDDLSGWVEHADGYFQLRRTRANGESAQAVVIYGTNVPMPTPGDRPGDGVFVRIDRVRAWSIEVITPPPTAAE